jgi:hypothetical protein
MWATGTRPTSCTTTRRRAVAPDPWPSSETYLQAAAYAGYDTLYATGRVFEVGCWAHARRYFWEAKATDTPRALTALGFLGEGRAG